MEKNKKTVTLTVIGLVALLISIIGAAYAYYKIGVENNFGTPKIDASTAALGGVKLVSTDSNLYLNLSRKDMMEANADYYYAVTDSSESPIISSNNDEEAKSKTFPTIGYVEVTGDGTYDCDYEFEVTYEGNLKEALLEKDATKIFFGLGLFNGEPDYANFSNRVDFKEL